MLSLDMLKQRKERTDSLLSFPEKTAISFVAGGLGSVVGNPADLSMTRMIADNTLPPEQRTNYSNVFNALGRISREEGFTKLWRVYTQRLVN